MKQVLKLLKLDLGVSTDKRDEYFNAVPFLVWWFEEHDIAYSENLLTNMATGYCQASSRRELPTAKIEAYKASKKNKK